MDSHQQFLSDNNHKFLVKIIRQDLEKKKLADFTQPLNEARLESVVRESSKLISRESSRTTTTLELNKQCLIMACNDFLRSTQGNFSQLTRAPIGTSPKPPAERAIHPRFEIDNKINRRYEDAVSSRQEAPARVAVPDFLVQKQIEHPPMKSLEELQRERQASILPPKPDSAPEDGMHPIVETEDPMIKMRRTQEMRTNLTKLSDLEMAEAAAWVTGAPGNTTTNQELAVKAASENQFDAAMKSLAARDQTLLNSKESAAINFDREFRSSLLEGNRISNTALTPAANPYAPPPITPDSALAISNPRIAIDGELRTRVPDKSDPKALMESFMHPEVKMVITPESESRHLTVIDSTKNGYREVVQNVIIYSYDRNWMLASTGNRYNFVVRFGDGAQNTQTDSLRNFVSDHPNVAIQEELRNVVSIELTNIIVPHENLDMLITQGIPANTATGSAPYPSLVLGSVLSPLNLPFINVRIKEHDNTQRGSSQQLNTVFSTLRYDKEWTTDSNIPEYYTHANSSVGYYKKRKGYILFRPSAEVAAKDYRPTPIANIKQMSITIERPDGTPLSTSRDSYLISNLYTGNNFAAPFNTTQYLFIKTEQWFPFNKFEVGDYLVARDFIATGITTELQEYINRPNGHIIIDIGRDPDTDAGTYVRGPNSYGYANLIIINTKYSEELLETGAATPYVDFGTLNVAATSGACINRSLQVQLAFRITSREYDIKNELRSQDV
jgi:hypothetical protein